MDLSEIEQRYARHIKPNYGTVTPDELNFIQEMVDKHHPQSFVEIGMASGMSTGFIACFMDERGGGDLLSLDHDDQFFGDPSKPNGFLVPELYQGEKVNVDLVKFKTALDIHEFDRQFDMAFIDADKVNYITYFDMILPKMAPGGLIVVDNVLWSGRVLQADSEQEESTAAIVAFNHHIKQLADLDRVMLTVRDGMTLIVA